MMSSIFPWDTYGVTDYDKEIAHRYIGSLYTPADLVIAPDDKPYIYRWHLVKAQEASVYFHIQVADDPERPLHDHPWDNTSVILVGGYRETMDTTPKWTHKTYPAPPDPPYGPRQFIRKPGDVIFRHAHWSHRLLMPEGVSYTMSQFSCGPRVREWGFWLEDGWCPYIVVTKIIDGVSVHTGRKL